MPDYVRCYGYRSPDDVLSGPYQFTHCIKEETYHHWQSQPNVISNFDTFMKGGKLNDKGRWWNWLSVDEVLLDNFRPSEDAVLLVDVGAGRGHDLKAFRTKHPNARGRLILQELPKVVEQIVDLDESIERTPHNFFDPQPVKGMPSDRDPQRSLTDKCYTGARAYFLQSILHNWPTTSCRIILRNLAFAMTKGYSKLLISDLVLPNVRCPLPLAGLDLAMMFWHTGMERSEDQWQDLLSSEGLKIIKIWNSPGGDGAVIEAMLDEGEVSTSIEQHDRCSLFMY